MLHTLFDRRRCPQAPGLVHAVLEPSWHDNSVTGATPVPVDPNLPSYEERSALTLESALRWALEQTGQRNLYIYDHPMQAVELPPDPERSS